MWPNRWSQLIDDQMLCCLKDETNMLEPSKENLLIFESTSLRLLSVHTLQRARIQANAIFTLTYIPPPWRSSVHTCYYRDECWRWWCRSRLWKTPWESFPAITHWSARGSAQLLATKTSSASSLRGCTEILHAVLALWGSALSHRAYRVEQRWRWMRRRLRVSLHLSVHCVVPVSALWLEGDMKTACRGN